MDPDLRQDDERQYGPAVSAIDIRAFLLYAVGKRVRLSEGPVLTA
jgi:hypothetical protein